MKIHENLVQGSKSWLKLREEHFNASEAPSVFGESKYKSRTVLLNEKKGVKEKVSDHLQKLFDKGHETEDKARDLLEFETAETFEPIVATLEVEGLPLLASLDGISEDHKTIFEHKLWNEVLAENVRNNVLEPTYYWQLEQQLLVAGAERALFVVSDGTGVKREMMYYTSKTERRTKLIAGWHEFKKDLEAHEVKAKQEVVVAREQESFPIIKCSVEGSLVVSNLGEYIPVIKKLADEQMSLILETDQDFADKEAFNKNVKAGRATLKTQATDIEKQFESLAEFNGYVKQADTILQKLQSHGEKQVKEAKATKKLSIVNNAQAEFNKHLAELSETINKVQITQIVIDFEAVMKGKRSFEKMEEAVNAELAKAKIEANEIAQVIRKNLDSLTELAKNHKFLFSERAMLLLKDNDDLVNLIKARIAEHEQAEAERKRQEQERIEREAKEKAEREAKAKLKAEEKRIRDEERAKVEAEQAQKQQEEHRIAKDKRDQQQEYIASGEAVAQVDEKPVEQRLAERFKGEPAAEVEQPTAIDIQRFMGQIQVPSNTPEKEEIIDALGYLLICDDHQLNCEAMASLREQFKKFLG
tara:strand:- start:2320 stop:4080 length:1761 start_codon:yes stop_codon:yes gene_type:complete